MWEQKITGSYKSLNLYIKCKNIISTQVLVINLDTGKINTFVIYHFKDKTN